ncbi:MAG: transposase [Butyricimonas faecihominis]
MARWYNRVAESGFKSFNTIATFYEHSDEIINYFDNRSTSASAESINSKIKAFRQSFTGSTIPNSSSSAYVTFMPNHRLFYYAP